jgi:hypothetical protein
VTNQQQRLLRASLVSLVGAVVFLVLATANSGGYRYGISDQAYYLPAVQQHLDPHLFPKDRDLLNAQSHLMATDELTAAVVRATGASLPQVAVAVYVLTLLVLLLTAGTFGRGLGLPWWAIALLGVLLTFRHRIAKTGANSLEGYMHPRQLAFAVGVAAFAAVVRGRHGLAFFLIGAAAVLHPTTALWFGIVVAIAAFVSRRSWRPALAVAGLLVGAASIWAVVAGPLAARLVIMDPEWLNVLAEKDYLFPTDWRIDTWALNLAYPVVIMAIWRLRQRSGLATQSERGLMYGLVALVAVFLISVPLTKSHLALAVQLQVTRVFWILDFVTMVSVAWWLTRSRRPAIAALCIFATASAARGFYLLEVANPDRQLVTVSLPDTEWVDAMQWLSTQPSDWHVLADPGHAWKYGVSVRVAASRDTLLESVKDSALALYDRDVAMRVKDRTQATLEYDQITTARVLALDVRFQLDAVVVHVDHALNLPLLYRNDRFAIYDVR